MKTKDQTLLEEAYLSIYKLNEGAEPVESPEGANLIKANMGGLGKDGKEKAAAAIKGKHVTIYKRVWNQEYADKTDLTAQDHKDGIDQLHSTASVTGAKALYSGVVEDVIWPTPGRDIRLSIKADGHGEHMVVPYANTNILVVNK